MVEKALPFLPGYKKLNDIFLLLNFEKNSDGTKNLILRGNELQLRINQRISDTNVQEIRLFMSKHTTITKLDLQYNPITDVGFETIVDYILKENTLKYLNLMGCDITSKGMKYMYENINELNLIDLRLSGNKINQEGGIYLAMLLEKNDIKLEYLDIGETDQTLQSIAYFMQALNFEQGNNKTIRVFDISRPIPYVDSYLENDEQLSDMISLLLKSNKCLIELHLQKCQLDGHDIEILVQGLKHNETLLFLDIGYNRIGDYGIEQIGKYLSDCPQLIGLNVAGNGIQDTGARALSFHLPYSRIKLLDISHNKINDSGILDLLNSIKKGIQMSILNIWGNKMSHNAAVVLRRMLLAGTLNPKHVDVCVYGVDKKVQVAFNPSDWYKHYYYCQLDYGVALPFKIKRNKVLRKHKKRIEFKYYPVIPGYQINKKIKPCTCCVCELIE